MEKPFTFRDSLVFAVCELVAIPLCDASWHAIVTEQNELLRGITGLAVGVPVGIIGVSFHWWKERLDSFGRTAIYWWPIALVLAFVYVAGPEIYRRAVKPIPSNATRETISEPAQPVELPTFLRLQFDADGKAQEINKTNLNWHAINPVEKEILSRATVPLLSPQCADGSLPYVQMPTIGNVTSYSDPAYCLDKSKELTFVLVFEKPILFKRIELNAHGAALPDWDNTLTTSQFSVLTIHGELKNMVLDITMVK